MQARISNTVLLNNITIPAAGSDNEGSAGSGGGGGGNGGGSVPGPAPVVGAPVVSPTVSLLSGSLGLVVEGTVGGYAKNTAAGALSQPSVAGGFFQSSSTSVTAIDSAIQSDSQEVEVIVDDLFAGFADEELGKIFR